MSGVQSCVMTPAGRRTVGHSPPPDPSAPSATHPQGPPAPQPGHWHSLKSRPHSGLWEELLRLSLLTSGRLQ